MERSGSTDGSISNRPLPPPSLVPAGVTVVLIGTNQIVDGIHRYFEKELGLSPAECNDIHHR